MESAEHINPLVSIQIITYNHEKFIGKAIESVLSQKVNFKYELIIGEDCSIDNTRDIIYQYIKKYPDIIKLISSESNVGMFKNEERALKECNGKYIAFLEGDDFWSHPDKLQKQVDFLENNPEYGMVHTNFNRYFERSKKTEKNVHDFDKRIINSGNNIFEDLLIYNYIGTLTVLVRKELIDKYFEIELYKKNGWLMSDKPFWLELSKQTSIGYINESMATYRIMKNSASHSESKSKNYAFFLSSHEIKMYYVDKYGCSDKTKKTLEDIFGRVSLKYAFHSKNKTLAKESIKKILYNNLSPKDKFIVKLYYLATLNVISWFIIKVLNIIKIIKFK